MKKIVSKAFDAQTDLYKNLAVYLIQQLREQDFNHSVTDAVTDVLIDRQSNLATKNKIWKTRMTKLTFILAKLNNSKGY